MTTIVNTPAPTSESNNSVGMIIGLFVLAVVLYVLFVYGLPAIKRISSPQINIPNKIDVNIQETK